MSGFFAEVLGFVACLVGAACLGSGVASLLIEILNRRK